MQIRPQHIRFAGLLQATCTCSAAGLDWSSRVAVDGRKACCTSCVHGQLLHGRLLAQYDVIVSAAGSLLPGSAARGHNLLSAAWAMGQRIPYLEHQLIHGCLRQHADVVSCWRRDAMGCLKTLLHIL
jgi:hypothetical protein